MKETQRIAYLRQMGYQQYYSRFVMPGAKASVIDATALAESEAASTVNPSRKAKSGRVEISSRPDMGGRSDLPEQAQAIKSGAADPAIQSTSDKSGTDKARKVSKVLASSRPDTGPAPASTPDAKVVATQANTESLRFNLQFYRINGQLAVVNESPHQLRGKDNKDALGLLQNILLALGVDKQSLSSLQADGFQWPIAEGMDAGSDPKHAAKLALEGFISQRHEQIGFQNLLLLNAQLSPMMAVAEEKQTLGDLKRDKSAYKLTLSHSLQAMLAHPELKREAWMHMQALRRRIESS